MTNSATDRFEVPLLFAPQPDATAAPAPALEPLVYKLRDYEGTQSHLVGRKVIEPEIDLDAYRFEAVIDWIEIGIHTQRSTNFQTLNRRLKELTKREAFTGWQVSEQHGNKIFRTTIQDPRHAEIAQIEQLLEDHFGLAEPVMMLGMEIAIDIYANSGSVRDRAAMVVVLQRHHMIDQPEWTDRYDDLRHFYEGQSKPSYVIQAIKRKPGGPRPEILSDVEVSDPDVRERILRTASHRAPYVDSFVYRGRRDGDVMIRIQNKTTDKRHPGKDSFERLPPEEHRARIEVTLQGGALGEVGLTRLNEMPGFRFETLNGKFFSFWHPTVPARGPGAELLIEQRCGLFAQSGVYGLDLYEQALLEKLRQDARDANRGNGRQSAAYRAVVPPVPRAKVKRGRVAFSTLNEKVRKALIGLTRRTDKGSRRRRRAGRAQRSFCTGLEDAG